MHIVINYKNLTPGADWQQFRKARGIIRNANGDFAISEEGGKCIFPGGKCEKEESELQAIKRELKEELGIAFADSQLQVVLILETIYEDFFDYRTNSKRPRHTITTYFYGETDEKIDFEKLSLTEGEKSLNFKSYFVSKEELFRLVGENHSNFENGKFFDEENAVVMEQVFKRKLKL